MRARFPWILLASTAASLLGATWVQAQAPTPKAILVEAAPTGAADALRLVPPIGHTDLIADVALLPSRPWVVSAGWDGLIRVWDLSTGRELRTFAGHAGARSQAYCVAAHPGGRQVASGANDGYVRIWEADTGREVTSMRVSSPNALTYLPDGRLMVASSKVPVAIYDPLTGQKVREFPGVQFSNHAELSADGKTLVAGYGQFKSDTAPESGTAYICDVETGALRHTLTHPRVVIAVAMSGDGKLAATADFDNTIRLWDTSTGQVRHTLTGYDSIAYGSISCMTFTPDGSQLLSGGAGGQHGQTWVWDTATGKKLRQVKIHNQHIKAMALTADGSRVVTASKEQELALWDRNTGTVERRFTGSMEHAAGIAFSPDGSRVLTAIAKDRKTGWTAGAVRLWDLRTGRDLRRFQARMQVLSSAYSPDGKLVAAAGQGEINVWEADTGKSVLSLPSAPGGFYHCLAFTPDSKQLVASAGHLELYDLATGKLARKQEGPFSTFAISPDGALIAGAGTKEVVIVKADTGEEVRRLTFTGTHPSSHASGITFGADGKTLALAGYAVNLHVWEVATGALRANTHTYGVPAFQNFQALSLGPRGEFAFSTEGGVQLFDANGVRLTPLNHNKNVHQTAFLPDGRLFTVADDGVLRLWDTKGAVTELSYLPLEKGDWLAISGDGRFDGSPGGIAQCYFARGVQTYDLDQFAEQFRAPGLVGTVLAPKTTAPVADGPLAINLENAVSSGAPPRVAIASPRSGAATTERVEVAIEITEQGKGGIGGVRLYHNDRLVGGTPAVRGIEVVAPANPGAGGETLTKTFPVQLVAGENVLRAVALSRTGLESAPAEVRLSYTAAPAGKPSLHVLAVGINKYRDATLDLSYARPDAEAIAGFFQSSPAAKNLFAGVKVTRLLDSEASGEAIRKALAELATATRPEDVVFLYFAGHGEMAPGGEAPGAAETFFFLPTEMRQIALKERVRELGISGSEIEGTLGKMAARKIVLVYDACKSGGAVAGGVRGVADEQQALGALARAQGIHILTASTSQQYAGEVTALGHGILTYALLEGLQGKAARSGNPAIYVRELMSYVEDRVPELARQHRGREQWPVPFGRGQNFPVALGQ